MKSVASRPKEMTLPLCSALVRHNLSAGFKFGLPSTRDMGITGVNPVKGHKCD